LIPALEESVAGVGVVRVHPADALAFEWLHELSEGPWVLAGNLPYNIATPLVLETLARAPAIGRLVVMVQREVGERLAAGPTEDAYGVPSLRVAYRAQASVVRRVPPEVFWPRPKVASVVVRLVRRDRPPVDVDEARLWRVVDAGFAERRKTMRNALRRLGLGRDEAEGVLSGAGIDPAARAETLSLEDFARLAETVPG
jgi:16S rRNA (adenine1518-N6/adenine1519-N6)-dimethyltransferase